MGGQYRVRRPSLDEGQANTLALAISGADSVGARAMEPWNRGGIRPNDFLPNFRREVKRLLSDPDVRLSADTRALFQRFGARFGLQTHGDGEPLSVVRNVRFSPSMWERMELVAAGMNMDPAELVRAAVSKELERLGSCEK